MGCGSDAIRSNRISATNRLLRGVLLLSITVAVLVIVGLVNFDLLIEIIPRLIAAIVVVGVFALILKRLFFRYCSVMVESDE